MSESRTLKLPLEREELAVSLFGMNDRNAAVIEQECGVTMSMRQGELQLSGSPEKAMAVLSGGIGGIRDEALKTSLRKEPGRYRRKLFGGRKHA